MTVGVLGTRLEPGQVRPRVGLGVELAPDLLGGQHLLQVALLLRLGAVHDDRRPDEADAEPVDRRRRPPARPPALPHGPPPRPPPPPPPPPSAHHPPPTPLAQPAGPAP